MAQTTEDFLVSVGIDKTSIDNFLGEVEAAKAKASEPTTIPIEFDVELDQELADEMRRFREEEEAAALAAQELAVGQAAAARAAEELQQEMEAAAAATTKAMAEADAGLQELQGGIIAAGVAAAALTVTLARASSEAAGDEQAYAQLGIAFGSLKDKAAEASEAIGKSTGRAVGSVQQLLAETSLSVQAFGFVGDEALKVSQQLVQTAIDMAAVTGADAGEILLQFSTGLALSGRALLRYGINLDEARVKAEAFKLGFGTKELTQNQKAQVKLAIILKDTAKFTGAASGAQQTFTETMKDLQDSIAQAFGELGVFVNEIIKPFVASIDAVVIGLKTWFKANPRLTKVVAAFGITVTAVLTAIVAMGGAIAISVFAYKQYAAVQAVITGAQIALAASTTVATAATIADTAATATNTVAKDANTVATTASIVAQSTVGKAVIFLNGLLTISTAQVWANTRAWVALTLTKVGDFIFNAYNSLGNLVPILKTNVLQVSLLATAVSALAVAYLGFKIGGQIEEWLGLADAQERVQKGTASLGDTIKSRVVDGILLAIPVIGWAALAWKKYYEAQSLAVRSANAEQIRKSVQALDPARQQLYNRYLKEGMVEWRALKAAVGDTAGELTRFTFLLGKGKKATTLELAELNGLFEKLSVSVPGFAARYSEAMGRAVPVATERAILSLEQAKKVITDTQKSFDEFAKSLNAAEVKLNVGEDTAKAFDDLTKLGAAMDLFRKRAIAHQDAIVGLNKAQISGPNAATRAGAPALVAIEEKALAELRRLSGIAAREQTRLIEESFVKQAATVRAGYDTQVKLAEDAKNKIISVERAKLEELQTLLEKEQDIRKTANERAKTFEKSLDEQKLRRKDAALADIQALRESAEETLKDVSNQEARARILAKVTEELQRLATSEEKSKEISKDLAEARKQGLEDAKALKDAKGPEDTADATERLAATQKTITELAAKLAEEEKLKAERTTKASEEAKALAATSAAQALIAQTRDQEILALQQEKLNRQKAINDEEVHFQEEVIKSKAEYEKKIEALDRFKAKMEEIVALQTKLTTLLATPGADAQKEAKEVSGTLTAAQAGLRQTVQQSQPLIAGETTTFDAEVKKSVDALVQQLVQTRTDVTTSAATVAATELEVAEAKTAAELSTVATEQASSKIDISMSALAAAMARIQPTADAIVQKVAAIETAVSPIPQAMDSALNSQDKLAASVEKLGGTTVEFARGMKARWDEATKRLVFLESAVSRLGAGGGEAAASGL